MNGGLLIADALSRAPVFGDDDHEDVDDDDTVFRAITISVPTSFQVAANADEEYRRLLRAWKEDKDPKLEDWLSPYAGIWSRISHLDGLLILDDTRLIVPRSIRPSIIDALHVPHTGVVKSLENARQLCILLARHEQWE